MKKMFRWRNKYAIKEYLPLWHGTATGRLKKVLCLSTTLVFCLLTATATTQGDVTVQCNGVETFQGCGFTIYSKGYDATGWNQFWMVDKGVNSACPNTALVGYQKTVTVVPDAGKTVHLRFEVCGLNINAGNPVIRIYYGSSATGTPAQIISENVGQLTNITGADPIDFYGSAPNQPVTFKFMNEDPLWDGRACFKVVVVCDEQSNDCPDYKLTLNTGGSTPQGHKEGDYTYFDVCPEDNPNISIKANKVTPTPASGSSPGTYYWSIGTETGTGQTANFTTAPATGYNGWYTFMDKKGCPSDTVRFRVRTSRDPLHDIPALEACEGGGVRIPIESDNYTVDVSGSSGSPGGSPITIGKDYGNNPQLLYDQGTRTGPSDDRGVPCEGDGLNRSPVTMSGNSGVKITNVNQIKHLCINFEHGYAGDLWIGLKCPNGNHVTILKRILRDQCAELGYVSGKCGVTSVGTEDSIPGTRMWSANPSIFPSTEWGWDLSVGADPQFRFGDQPVKDVEDDMNPCADDDAVYMTNQCDPANNSQGTCKNYCWSPDATMYVYDSHNVTTQDWPAGNQFCSKSVKYMTMNPSNPSSGTNFFKPDGNFSDLVGCPIDGKWELQIIDILSFHNGYLCGWELELDIAGSGSNPTPSWSYTMQDYETWITGPAGSQIDGDSVTLPAGTGPFTYTVHLRDRFNCEYTREVTVSTIPATHGDTTAQVCESDLPYTWRGQTYDRAGRYENAYTLKGANRDGCDSIIDLIIETLPTQKDTIRDTICGETLRNTGYTWTRAGIGSGQTDTLIKKTGTYHYTIPGSQAKSGAPARSAGPAKLGAPATVMHVEMNDAMPAVAIACPVAVVTGPGSDGTRKKSPRRRQSGDYYLTIMPCEPGQRIRLEVVEYYSAAESSYLEIYGGTRAAGTPVRLGKDTAVPALVIDRTNDVSGAFTLHAHVKGRKGLNFRVVAASR